MILILLFLATIFCATNPEPAISADFSFLEPDSRTVPWSVINRHALEAGKFPPLYHPISEGELGRLLSHTSADWWQNWYQYGNGLLVWQGCPQKNRPPAARVSARMIAGFTQMGDILNAEAGLAQAPGWNTSLEPTLDLVAGPLWGSFTVRLHGQLASGGSSLTNPGDPDYALSWPGWRVASGRSSVRRARLSAGQWLLDFPQALLGVQLGHWSFSAGLAPRITGPGLTGALVFGDTAKSIPAVTVRRTKPFYWRGFFNRLAPDDLMFRVGKVSARNVHYRDSWGLHTKHKSPWFIQWLVGWEITNWFRTTLTHSVVVTAREGTLWPDLLQINFPVVGTTWREADYGPITDRLFAAQFELRWCNSPVPFLPSAAGRAYWDYGGTDFLPSGPGGLIPELSIPASIVGFELVSPTWDLAAEYAELVHENVLWYSNGGFTDGYSNDGWVLGHPLGGSGESFTSLVRLRPDFLPVETQVRAQYASWGTAGQTPGTGERYTAGLTIRSRPELKFAKANAEKPGMAFRWEIVAQWIRERADNSAYPTAEKDWVRVYCRLYR